MSLLVKEEKYKTRVQQGTFAYAADFEYRITEWSVEIRRSDATWLSCDGVKLH